jgi:HPt (histidine-containing phosphotransfer) domain-containing protein
MSEDLRSAIAAIWRKSIPQTRERLKLLQRAADDLVNSRTIDTEQRSEAASVAHKLAGSLGMFGFNDATDYARVIEVSLDQAGLPQPERLQEQVAALVASMEPHLKD